MRKCLSKKDKFKLSFNEMSMIIFQLLSSFKFYLLLFFSFQFCFRVFENFFLLIEVL